MHGTVKEQNLWAKQNLKEKTNHTKASNVLISEQLTFASNLSNISFTSLCSDFNYIFKDLIRKIILLYCYITLLLHLFLIILHEFLLLLI